MEDGMVVLHVREDGDGRSPWSEMTKPLNALIITLEHAHMLPWPLEGLHALTHLHITSCYNMTSLPDSIGQLHELVNLWLMRCTALTELPYSLGRLEQLNVDMRWCRIMQTCHSNRELRTHLRGVEARVAAAILVLASRCNRCRCNLPAELWDVIFHML